MLGQLRGALMRLLKGVILLSAFSVGVAVFYVFGILVGLWGEIRSEAAAEGIPIETPTDSLALRQSSFVVDACRLIDRVARANEIPGDYIARLISVESGFSPTAVSPKGAQGIAQFMPERRAYAALLIPLNLAWP